MPALIILGACGIVFGFMFNFLHTIKSIVDKDEEDVIQKRINTTSVLFMLIVVAHFAFLILTSG